MVYVCSVSGCPSSTKKYGRNEMEGVIFFPFPSHDQAKKRRWMQLCRRKGKVVGAKENENVVDTFKDDRRNRICSRHFKAFTSCGYPVGDPELFPWNNWGVSTHPRAESVITKLQAARAPPSPQQQSVLLLDDGAISVCTEEIISQTTHPRRLVGAMKPLTEERVNNQDVVPPPGPDHDYHVSVPEPVATTADACVMTDLSMADIKSLESRPKKPNPGEYFMSKVLVSDASVQHYTGFPNRKGLEDTYEVFSFAVGQINYWRGPNTKARSKSKRRPGPRRKLQPFYEFVLTLIKLRQDYSDKTLADWFDVNESTVSSIFITWINYLDQVMVPVLLFWPDRATVLRTMPTKFRKWYPRCRIIIDGAEFPIQRFRNPTSQYKTYSNYKSTNTLKIVVGIAPNGTITYVSDMYSGNISDKYLTKVCGLLDLLEPGDQVMADRGFKIQDLLLQINCTLVIPPFTRAPGRYSKARRLTTKEVRTTRRIANLRIHVERAIRRIKAWRMMSHRLPVVSKATASQMVRVVAAVCNLLGRLY